MCFVYPIINGSFPPNSIFRGSHEDCISYVKENNLFGKVIVTEDYPEDLILFCVAPIINGCSQETIYTGTLKDCKAFVREKLAVNPKSDFIITETYVCI